ncbi:leucine-rich repeat domain-containing protein [Sphaerisporangium perillae]|uniref:leucine-rich repeat domain-containing protein n=1 Tax=Sphaerisporangium perillae TaxID=2935860 RepID=UPI003FD8EC45
MDGDRTTAGVRAGAVARAAEFRASGAGLDRVPEAIGDLPDLRRIDLAWNRITDVPPSIGRLRRLAVLLLDGNRLTGLPQEIGRLGALRELHLDGNALEASPGPCWS